MASYEKTKQGYWSVRFREVIDGQFLNKRISRDENNNRFIRKKDAEESYRAYLELSKNKQLPISVINFDEAIKAFFVYLESEREITDSSYISDDSIFKQFIIPFLQLKDFNTLTDRDLREFKDTIKDYSYNYKSKVFSRLGFFFRFLDTYYDTNFVKQYNKVPKFKDKSTKQDIDFWDYNEYQAFIKNVDDDYWALVFDTLYWSGCRKGEIFGLKVNKVSFKDNLFKIDSQVTYKTKDKTDKPYAETPPKSKNGIRDVLMPEQVIKRIEKSITDKQSNDFVFGGKKPIAPETLRKRFDYYINKTKDKMKEEDLPESLHRITPHDLRHSHVSFIINNTGGGDLTKLYAIADRIGDTVDEVLKTYGHLFKSSQINLINDIENYLKPT